MKKDGKQKLWISVIVLILVMTTFVPVNILAEKDTKYYNPQEGLVFVSDESPANGSLEYVDPATHPTLRAYVNNSLGKNISVYFHTNASGTWECLGGTSCICGIPYDCDNYYYNNNTEVFWKGKTKYWWSVNATDGDSGVNYTNKTYWFGTQSQQTHVDLKGLTDTYVTWSTYKPGKIYCNTTAWYNETIEVNITVNVTNPISKIKFWVGDLTNGSYTKGAGNITMLVSSDNLDAFFVAPNYDDGNGNGTFVNGGVNITVNGSSWPVPAAGPWFDFGNGTHIQQNCSIYVRFCMDVSADDEFLTYENPIVWKVYTEGSGIIDTDNFNGTYRRQEGTWIKKSGYNNCTWGVPDFDQKQDEWYNPVDGNWVYCGPTALADCLWWLDCKYHNRTKNYLIPDWCGQGSKHPNNVYYLINWTAQFTNTTKAEAVEQPSGTTAENFTKGIWGIFENRGVNETFFTLLMEGYTQGINWDEESVNYTNITTHIANCDDVILLLGFWCKCPGGAWQRMGGHYVQCNGYNNDTDALSLSDPFKDNAENGGWGWNSTHDAHPLINGSHNNTYNVSYDYYYVSDAPAGFSGFADFIQLDNYMDGMGNVSINWTDQNNYDNTYVYEGCGCIDTATIVEIAWYIQGPQDCNATINKTIWNGTAWVDNYTNPTVGSTITTNITIHNYGKDITSLNIGDGYADAWVYQPGTSYIYLPNGSSYAREPDYIWECSGESCEEYAHGGMNWYINATEGSVGYDEILYIHTNWTVNNSRYSENYVYAYVCTNKSSCFWPNVSCSTDYDYAYLNQKLNTTIECEVNPIETSEWIVSEYSHRNCTSNSCLDQNWTAYSTSFDDWHATYTTEADWGWVYRFSDAAGNAGDEVGMSYTIADNSSSNRSQSIARLRNSYVPTGDNKSFIGIIYSFYNNSNYDMVLYGESTLYALSKRGDDLFNSNDTTLVINKEDAYNYYVSDWSCNDTIYGELFPDVDGIWSKIIYSHDCKYLQAKAWNEDANNISKCMEPPGWVINESINSDVCVDDFSVRHKNTHWDLETNHPSCDINVSSIGQSFMTPDDIRYAITAATFNIKKTGTLNGNISAALYEAINCTDETEYFMPVGNPLAISDVVNVTSLPSGVYVNLTFFFTGDQQYLMETNHNYSIQVYVTNASNFSFSNEIYVSDSDAYSEHPGNEVFYENGAWDCIYYDFDVCHYVFGRNTTPASCFGLAYWNPDDVMTILADYDYIDNWKLNYSRDPYANQSMLENHSIFANDGIPYTYFVASNYTQITENVSLYHHFLTELNEGNLTNNTFNGLINCIFKNISELTGMESRAKLDTVNCTAEWEWDNQDDNVYYYNGVSTNTPGIYNTGFGIQIEACNDGTNDNYDGATVAIDVDNNMQWDDNDIVVNWYKIGTDVHYTIYNGTTEKNRGILSAIEDDMYAMVNVSYVDCLTDKWQIDYTSFLPALHRYSAHQIYTLILPSFYLEKGHVGSGIYLNSNDTFGLHIMTVDSENRSCVVWENWNESSCVTYTDELDVDLMWDTYLNLSNGAEISDFYTGMFVGINETNIKYWGQGKIGTEMGFMTEHAYSLNITKVINRSQLINTSHNNTVNFTITVCNNGTLNLTGIVVEDTLPRCCIYLGSSLPDGNVTGSGKNWTFNVTHNLTSEDCITFNITVNFTKDCGIPSGTILINYANVSCNESATATAYDDIIYGENSPPEIYKQYPTDAGVGTLLLTNISVSVRDPNADAMDVYITSNKTISLDISGIQVPHWHSIGINTSVNNGTYECNQIFDMDNDNNHTRWRWGNTKYYWNVSVTDGLIWTNESFTFTTNLVRYDVQAPLGIVSAADAQATWNAVSLTYDGLYDVQAPYSVLSGADAQKVWNEI